MHTRPIQPLEKRRELGWRQPHHAILDGGPAELPAFETLGQEAKARLIPEQQLHAIRPLGPEHVNDAREGVSLELFLHERREPIHPLAEVDRLRRHEYADARRRHDHSSTFAALKTSASVL